MARHNRRSRDAVRPLGLGSVQRTESYRGEDYTVRTVAGASSVKPYRCPGCQQLIPPGTPHVVVWAYDDTDAADRRHWHRTCWQARDTRRPR